MVRGAPASPAALALRVAAVGREALVLPEQGSPAAVSASAPRALAAQVVRALATLAVAPWPAAASGWWAVEVRGAPAVAARSAAAARHGAVEAAGLSALAADVPPAVVVADRACAAGRLQAAAPVVLPVAWVLPAAQVAAVPGRERVWAPVWRAACPPAFFQVRARPAAQGSSGNHSVACRRQPMRRRLSGWWWQAAGVSVSSWISVRCVEVVAGNAGCRSLWALICRDHGRSAACG